MALQNSFCRVYQLVLHIISALGSRQVWRFDTYYISSPQSMELLLEFIFAHIIKGSQVADTLYSNIIANDIDKGKSASCKSDFAHSTYFR